VAHATNRSINDLSSCDPCFQFVFGSIIVNCVLALVLTCMQLFTMTYFHERSQREMYFWTHFTRKPCVLALVPPLGLGLVPAPSWRWDWRFACDAWALVLCELICFCSGLLSSRPLPL
jgi:hypothetical protein